MLKLVASNFKIYMNEYMKSGMCSALNLWWTVKFHPIVKRKMGRSMNAKEIFERHFTYIGEQRSSVVIQPILMETSVIITYLNKAYFITNLKTTVIFGIANQQALKHWCFPDSSKGRRRLDLLSCSLIIHDENSKSSCKDVKNSKEPLHSCQRNFSKQFQPTPVFRHATIQQQFINWNRRLNQFVKPLSNQY